MDKQQSCVRHWSHLSEHEPSWAHHSCCIPVRWIWFFFYLVYLMAVSKHDVIVKTLPGAAHKHHVTEAHVTAETVATRRAATLRALPPLITCRWATPPIGGTIVQECFRAALQR